MTNAAIPPKIPNDPSESCTINCWSNQNGRFVVVGRTEVKGTYQYKPEEGRNICIPDGFNLYSDISDALAFAVHCSNLYADGLNTGVCKPYCWAGG